MFRIFAVLIAVLPVFASGCGGWQANNASQAVDINPFNWGSGSPVFSPSNSPGYTDGMAQDMRRR